MYVARGVNPVYNSRATIQSPSPCGEGLGWGYKHKPTPGSPPVVDYQPQV
jgi:hypothetical protein